MFGLHLITVEVWVLGTFELPIDLRLDVSSGLVVNGVGVPCCHVLVNVNGNPKKRLIYAFVNYLREHPLIPFKLKQIYLEQLERSQLVDRLLVD